MSLGNDIDEVIDHCFFEKIKNYGGFEIWFKKGLGYYIIKVINGSPTRINKEVLNNVLECEYLIDNDRYYLRL